MIAKVIVHDRDRASAMRRMAALMGETEVVGVTTNAALLKALCSHPAFVGGEIDTGFIERHRDELFAKAAAADDRAFAVATLARLVEWRRGGRGRRALRRSVVAVERAGRIPAARRGPRRGALEGRRARRRGDRPPAARRQRRPGAARRHRRGAGCSAPTTAGSPSGWAATRSRRRWCAGRPPTASTTRCSPTARAAACGWSIRSTSRNTRPLALTRRGARAAARQDHRSQGQGRRHGEQGPAAAGARGHEDGAHAHRARRRHGQERALRRRRAGRRGRRAGGVRRQS